MTEAVIVYMFGSFTGVNHVAKTQKLYSFSLKHLRIVIVDGSDTDVNDGGRFDDEDEDKCL